MSMELTEVARLLNDHKLLEELKQYELAKDVMEEITCLYNRWKELCTQYREKEFMHLSHQVCY